MGGGWLYVVSSVSILVHGLGFTLQCSCGIKCFAACDENVRLAGLCFVMEVCMRD